MELPKSPIRPHPRLARGGLITLTVAALVACGGHVSQQATKEEDAGKRADHADAPAPSIPATVASVSQDDGDASPGRANAKTDEPAARISFDDGFAARQALPAASAEQQRLLNHRGAITGQMLHARSVANEPLDRETYAHVQQHGVKVAAQEPISTFSIDVDTGAYSNMRRFLSQGQLPPEDAVRVEELINYFSYEYTPPERSEQPFSVRTEVAPTPWNPDTLLMQVGIKGYENSAAARPPANLVFLIDVSGSMNSPLKLPLLKSAFRMLTNNLDARDRVSMVVYAGASGVVLEPTAGDDGQRILSALDGLRAGGSTNGASGIHLAYQKAREAFIDGGINRVLLATDGDFNVGVADFDRLIDIVERARTSGVSLTTLGFGSGNYNDKLMERLADAGDGNHAYIDGLNEARKVLVDQLGATLYTIAKDVKIQVEFNPAQVAEYRLIGYENRALRTEDFNNDKIDAGEIGAGHTVTAIYEVTPVDSSARLVDPRRYAAATPATVSTHSELAFVRLRYKTPTGDTSKLIELAVPRTAVVAAIDTSDDFRFAAAVSAFGQQLKGGLFTGDYRLDETAALASSALGPDTHGYRREFLALVRNAAALAPGTAVKVGHSDAVAH